MFQNVYRNTELKIWFNMNFKFTWNWRQFDVNVLEKKNIAYKKKFWEFACALWLKSDISITVCS